MSRYDYDDSYPRYVPVGDKKRKNEKALENARKKKADVQPVIIDGTKIAKSWWGKSWCANLERYADYANRIGRGRSYVRYGAVLDLKINSGKVTALVQGSSRKPYQISVNIAPIKPAVWRSIQESCSGKINTLSALIEGKFPKEMAEIFTLKGSGLFPSPAEIDFDCSCPDWASMCKHVAAVLYGIGARLDHDPALFFTLRQVDINELISQAVVIQSEIMLKKAGKKTKRVIEDADVSAVFGIDLEPAIKKPIKGSKRTKKVKS
jgi:uncharacterized Zn finger protein